MTSQQTHYKPTGINWLSSIPQHWKSLKLRSILKHVSTKNRPNLPLLSITRERGIILRDISSKEENHNYIPDDLSNYKVVSPGQFGINKMKAWQGSYGVSAHHGIISPAYYTFNLTGVTCDFFHLAIRSKAYIPFFTQASDGVRVGQWDLSLTRMKEIPFFIPPEDEQRKIVKIINLVNLKLNKFIQKKKRLIELLKEQKQAIINQAVFRGLDPNIRLKPSGIEWLGDIPEHWEIKKLKYLVKNHTEQVGNKGDDEVYVALEHVESWTGKLNLPDEVVPFESSVKRFATGDILFGKLRPYLAKVIQSAQKGVCVGEFLVLRCIDSNLSNNFLEILLRSKRIIDIITASTFGAKMPRADWNFIGNLPIAYPSKDEQFKIVSYLKNKTEKINKGIEVLTKQIDLIQEYRTRLISDVVTGQFDIRNIEIDDIVEEGLIEETFEEEQEDESLELVGAGDDD